MEHYQIFKLLNHSTVSKFAARKLISVNDLSDSQHYVNKNIRLKDSIPESSFYDYNDA